MTQKTRKIESAHTDREQLHVKAVETDGSTAGTRMRDEHTPSSRQDSTTPPSPIPNLPTPADKPASIGIDATSSAFNRLRQAIETLESIQAKRKADSGQLQPAGSNREHVSKTSNSPASSPSESFEIVADCADENEPHAEPSGPDDVVDVSPAAGDEAGSAYLYQGPPDRGAVSSSQQGRVADAAAQSKRVYGANPRSPKFSSGTAGVRKAESVLDHPLADALDRMLEREPESVRFPNSARENVGMNSNTAFVKTPSKANSKEDWD